MKTLTLLMLILVGITGFAQNNQDHKMHTERQMKMTAEQRADKMTQRLTEKLDLNTAQQAKVRELYLKEARERKDEMNDRHEEMGKDKMKERKDRMKDRRKEMKENMKENRKENMQDFKEILTEKQYIKFQEMQAKRAEQFKNRGRGNRENKSSNK